MLKASKYAVLAALFAIPFLPLYVANDLFFPFISSKGFAFRILVEIAAAGWLLLLLADKRYRPKKSWTLILYGALVAWMFVADLFAMNAHKAFWSNYERMDGWVTLVHVFLFFLVAGSVLSVEKLWKEWWLTVVAVSGLVSLHGLLQLACADFSGTVQPLFNGCANTFPIHQGGVRLDANLGNAAYLAAYLLFTIAASLWQALENKGWLRYLLIALAAIEALVLFFTATRGAFLGLVIAALLAGLLFAFSSGGAGKKAGAAVVAGLLLLAGGFFLIKDSTFVREDPTLARIASISLADGATRFTLWGMAWQGFLERPVTGWGHEGFNLVFNTYYDPALYAQEPWFDRAHDVYIDWLVSGGAPALLLFLALLVSGAWALSRSGMPRGKRILLLSAIAAYAFQALFVFDNLMSYFLLAAILALAHEASGKEWPLFEKLEELKGTALTGAASAVIILTIVIIWVVNVPGIMGGKHLIRGLGNSSPLAGLAEFKNAVEGGSFATQEIREQLVSFSNAVVSQSSFALADKQAVASYALSEMQKEVDRVPEDARLRLLFANGLGTVGDFERAKSEITTALALSPKKPAILIQRGLLELNMKDTTAARADFDAAYALAPGYPDTTAFAAAGRILSGDIEGGKALLMERFGTTTVDNEAVGYAYREAGLINDVIAISRARVASRPGDPMPRLELALTLASVGRVAEARAEVDAVVKAYPAVAAIAESVRAQINGTGK